MSLVRAPRAAEAPLGAFAAFGLELEYMLVNRSTLDVAPLADRALEQRQPRGLLGWSNELVAHVVELKNVHPSADLAWLAPALQAEVRAMNAALESLEVRLMPTGMHPWMDPSRETTLWPHDNAIYRTYHRIFDCRSHGWANLQSVHINLPFANDAEFARLHAAVRLALPIIPAISASSPYSSGEASGWLDSRLRAYETNAAQVPQMNGHMIPEPVSSRDEYERVILAPLYQALEPYDRQGVLRYEWANARGAIARFDRNAIEIRVVDTQECPHADVAVSALIIDLVASLYERDLPSLPTEDLARVFRACMREGERTVIDSPAYVQALVGAPQACEASALWARLAERMSVARHRRLWQPMLEHVLRAGPLARRMLRAAGERPSRAELASFSARLCECLQDGTFF